MTFQHNVRIAFLDVGQGDSIVVTIPETGEAIIIDCPEADTLITYLKETNVKYIRALLITHLHLDHYKEAVDFLENCGQQLGIECERLLFNWPVPANKKIKPDDHSENPDSDNRKRQRSPYKRLLAWTRQWSKEKCEGLLRNTQGGHLKINTTFDNIIQIIQPWHSQIGTLYELGLNNTAAVLRVQGSKSSVLLTSDIEPAGWKELIQDASLLQSTVLKFPHHGAWKNSDPADILDVVKPSLVIISVGTDGIKYQHPNQHVFDAIRTSPNIELMCTQVTTRCTLNPDLYKNEVISIIASDSSKHSMPFARTNRGCPCSGTIVIELGDQAEVLQPKPNTHRQAIISKYYHQAQCLKSI